MYYPCSSNCNREADLRLCFCLCKLLDFLRGGSNDSNEVSGHVTCVMVVLKIDDKNMDY